MSATRKLTDGLLTDASAVGKTLDPAGVFVGVFIEGPDPSPPVTAADFTLPDATAFPAVALTSYADISYLADGRSCLQAPGKIFRPPDATTPCTLRGWYIADAAVAGNVIAWGRFPNPVVIVDHHNLVDVIVRLTTDPAARWEATAAVSG